jgi:pimeloyl-ACP methyl ester carboxylesterase
LLDRWLFRHHPRRALRAVLPLLAHADRRLFETHPEFATAFVDSLAEAYRQGVGAAMREAALIAAPRGFAAAEIAAPVTLYQGDEDRHVPLAMAEYLAREIPLATLRRYPGEGHASIIANAAAHCFADFRAAWPAAPVQPD